MGEEKPRADEVMDYKGLAAYLKVAPGTLQHYVMKKRIPFTKVGVLVRFLKTEIDRWLLEGTNRPKGRAGVKGHGKSAGGGPPRREAELPWEAGRPFEKQDGEA
jgi:excisionase family DNA binding protein